MSDATWTAFWTTFNTYFWPGLFIFLGGLVVQIPLIIAAFKSNKKLDDVKTTALATKNELTTQVASLNTQVCDANNQLCEVKDHLSTVSMRAIRSQEDVERAHKAGKREGYEEGIPEGRRQASDFGGLSKQATDFNPLGK